jgi:hypothetical protein
VLALVDEEGLGGVRVWLIDTGLPALAEKLADWGQAFVDWVVNALPPLLEKAGDLLKALGDWVVEDGLPALGDDDVLKRQQRRYRDDARAKHRPPPGVRPPR